MFGPLIAPAIHGGVNSTCPAHVSNRELHVSGGRKSKLIETYTDAFFGLCYLEPKFVWVRVVAKGVFA